MAEHPHMKSRWANFPFAPSGWPFFYGWAIVVFATIGTIASSPGQTIGVSAFIDKLMGAVELSRTQISTSYMFGTITSSFLLPFAGSMVDRWGTRVSVVISSVGLAVSLMLLSNADFIPGLTSSTSVIIFLTAVAFLLIRFFGQGCLTMVSRVTIAKWFNHRRGLAGAISGAAVGGAFNVSPTILNKMVQNIGWQETYFILAGIIGIGIAFMGWLFYRDNPEQCGLVMDGTEDPDWIRKVSARVAETRKQFTRRQAVKTLAFWSYAIATGWQSFFMTAVTFHFAAIGQEMGLNRDQAYAIFPVIGVAGITATLVAGWLADRIRLKWLLWTMIIAQSVAAAGLLNFETILGRSILVVGYGISSGIFVPLLTVTWPRYFGRDHIGAINGMSTSILVFSSAIGPVLFSAARDFTGSFRDITIFCFLLPTALLMASLKVENPQIRIAHQDNS